MYRQLTGIIIAVCLNLGVVQAAEPARIVERPPALSEIQLREKLQLLQAERNGVEQLRQAKTMAHQHLYSSQQVKTIALTLMDDAARLEFAVAVYPCTDDPENFYEVYDAFRTFSKVLRLHDQIQAMRRPVPTQLASVPVTVSNEEMAEIVNTIRKEGIDSTKQDLARQIISSRNNFTSRQMKEIIGLLAFDSSRIEIAKFGFNHVLDPQNYFVVNDAFQFSSSKEELSRFVESRKRPLVR